MIFRGRAGRTDPIVTPEQTVDFPRVISDAVLYQYRVSSHVVADSSARASSLRGAATGDRASLDDAEPAQHQVALRRPRRRGGAGGGVRRRRGVRAVPLPLQRRGRPPRHRVQSHHGGEGEGASASPRARCIFPLLPRLPPRHRVPVLTARSRRRLARGIGAISFGSIRSSRNRVAAPPQFARDPRSSILALADR